MTKGRSVGHLPYYCALSNSKLLKNILIIIFFISQACYANNTPEISILTCSPGDEVYSVFGHSAIRIKDKDRSLDLVYNFGMFDFESPNFTLKFIKGKLEYYLGIQKTTDFIEQYTNENRLVLEQKLRLTENEKNKLIAKLNFLYRPENRKYFYSFLEKNCSTEIRDILSEIGVNFSTEDLEKSNRALINSHLQKKLWLRFGTSLMLGRSLDNNSDKFQSTFLPIYLKEEIGNSNLNGRDLVKSEQTLNTIEKKNKSDLQVWLSPIVIFSFLFLLFLFWTSKPVELVVCFIIGIIGLVLSLMWLFSEHPEVRYNFNVIWRNPLYLVYIPLMIRNKSNIILPYVLMMTILSTFLIWIFEIQSFDIAIIPILLILGVLNYKEVMRTRSNAVYETLNTTVS